MRAMSRIVHRMSAALATTMSLNSGGRYQHRTARTQGQGQRALIQPAARHLDILRLKGPRNVVEP